MSQRGLFYGWVVLAAAATVVAIGQGSLFALGVFLKPLEDSMRWSRSAISMTALINWMAMGAGSFFWGVVSDRVGSRAVTVAGGSLLGLGLVLSGQATALWQLHVTFGLGVGFAAGAFLTPLSATATKWFTANRGLAVGIVSAGGGAGMLAISPLVSWLTSAYDWRVAMIALGDLAWLVTIPVALLIRNAPAEMGAVARGGAAAPQRNFSTVQVLRAPQFWAIALTLCLLRRARGPDLPHGDPRDRPGRGRDARRHRARGLGPLIHRRADRLRPDRRSIRRQADAHRGARAPGRHGLRLPVHTRHLELLRGRGGLRPLVRRRDAALRARP